MAGVYISYPFCAQKCTYCNFASGVMPRALEAVYVPAVIREIETTRFRWIPDTVYLGGGTPSGMEPVTLGRLLAAVPGKPWREATLETAPGTVTATKASYWMEAGVNRISLGVQSFVQKELARTGRRHDAEVVLRDVAILRAAGLLNINIDLIAGLPGQTVASWAESLDWIERLATPHVSIYMLEIDEDSRLGKEMLLGGVRYGASDAPGEDLTAELYLTAVERLAAMGIARYEISNFARAGSESLHNLKYWNRDPYLGFGADAHSFENGKRRHNPETVDGYLHRGASSCSQESDAEEREEKFFVGLRMMNGVEMDAEDWSRHGQVVRRFVSGGFLEQVDSRIRLTDRGVMVSNEIFQEFLTA